MAKRVVMTAAVRDALQEELTVIRQVRKPALQQTMGSISAEVEPADRADEDLERGWITTESPLGAALLGRRRGDAVDVAAPDGHRTVTVVSAE